MRATHALAAGVRGLKRTYRASLAAQHALRQPVRMHSSPPLTSFSPEAQRAVVDLLDPADAAMAMEIFGRMQPVTPPEQEPLPPQPLLRSRVRRREPAIEGAIGASNALLIQLAKSDEASNLDKVRHQHHDLLVLLPLGGITLTRMLPHRPSNMPAV